MHPSLLQIPSPRPVVFFRFVSNPKLVELAGESLKILRSHGAGGTVPSTRTASQARGVVGYINLSVRRTMRNVVAVKHRLSRNILQRGLISVSTASDAYCFPSPKG